LSEECRRRSKEKKELEELAKLAAKHGKVISDKVEPTKAAEALKDIVKPGEKPEEKKQAGAAPFKMT
jgi:hypothetical protein